MRPLDKVINLLKKIGLILPCHCTYSHDTHSYIREPLFYCLSCKGRGWFWRKNLRPHIVYNSVQGLTSIKVFRIFSLQLNKHQITYIKLFKYQWTIKVKGNCKACEENSRGR